MNKQELAPMENLQKMIFTVRGIQVMLDQDLATVYGVETRVLNQAVKRNIDRFPEAFRFQITVEEKQQLVANCDRSDLRSQIVTSSGHGGRRYLPYVFTEQGVSMLSAVLRSETAIKASIQIINAFVEMRRFLQHNANVFARLDSVERRQITFESATEKNFEKIFHALEAGELPKQGIFYDGQVYDAYVFFADLISKAKSSLVLIDNYVDDSVLTLLGKRKKGVQATVYSKTISKQLALDLKKHNEQYPPIIIEVFKKAHDRFLIIDEEEIYHIGASLKDLGKKWFAFSKFEVGAVEMLKKLGGSHE
ncbi:MAG: ORF6N domain-containing protein [Proteobacteria bacterium]|nr:ORF6N domain-containing protein [Desulfobulbaceae bacterium]MBU4153604.1 ORF6N domain-containing protein [Pseudomonadota bacterium]